jgi:competence protein ComEC
MQIAGKKGVSINIPGPDPCRILWDQVKISILGRDGMNPGAHNNNNSLVTRIDFLSFSILFPGDIEEKREIELVNKKDFNLKSDVLIAPHHGSCSSSSELFLDKVGPSEVIISCGYRNRHKFPCRTVLQRYRRNRIAVFRTDLMGAVTLQSDGVSYAIWAHRKN